MILHESAKSILELKNKKVIKRLKKTTVTKRWFDTYQKLANNNPMYVKVLELIDDRTFVMEYISESFIDIEILTKRPEHYDRLTKDDIINITTALPSIFAETLEFSKSLTGSDFFIHTDMRLPNFVFTESKKIIALDPDSFTFVDNLDYVEKYYMASINIMHNIQKIFYYKQGKVNV